MSADITAGTPGYCEREDVQEAMQENDRSFGEFPLDNDSVDAAVASASRWFNTATDAHFYDSNAAASDLISSDTLQATDIRLSIPSSDHPQEGQLMYTSRGVTDRFSYPVTQTGRYARATTVAGVARLPAFYVESVDKLLVRETGGDVEDWVASSDFQQGRGEDYYLIQDGQNNTGRSYLYLLAESIGPRVDFEDILTVDLSYGLDWQDRPWPEVRRGVAHLAAAELTADDDLLAQVPENATISNVQTVAEMHLARAMDQPGYLSRWLGGAVA